MKLNAYSVPVKAENATIVAILVYVLAFVSTCVACSVDGIGKGILLAMMCYIGMGKKPRDLIMVNGTAETRVQIWFCLVTTITAIATLVVLKVSA